ncbi:DUF1540 domain-containing protein [Clostridium magnum]|uniref:DUF1540 domain-containing protein n=1 Tax=Clostridium magnum DSM 2767 TaxID=1121326 RepID=A0A161Y554_9CLOT|nr:DUF1540 domain-containing protein [Clostridium magnum]KZL93299.1 hypothetical protein CLMAG_03220 [Clostridium magnum DSM 2767]SHJ51584.1 protein of unknown function [Clostridium magnum DSM 2767]
MSKKLRCGAEHCYNNVNNFCIANVIHVGGTDAYTSPETACNTFVEKTDIRGTSHFINRNLLGGFRQLFSHQTVEMAPRVDCDAENCTYNVNKICGAEYVEIHGENATTSEKTQCETFR